MVGAQARRAQVAYVRGRGLSQRRACALLSVARSTLGYASRLAAKDEPVLTAMREFAAQYPCNPLTIRVTSAPLVLQDSAPDRFRSRIVTP